MAGTYDDESWLGIWLARQAVKPQLHDAKVMPDVTKQNEHDEWAPEEGFTGEEVL